MLLNSLKEKFEPKISAEKPQTEFCGNEECETCRGSEWWLPRGQSTWLCEHCSPPISEALVIERWTLGPRLVGSNIVTCCVPWCDACGGWQAREDQWSDGRTETRCRSCGAMVDDWPTVRVIPDEA